MAYQRNQAPAPITSTSPPLTLEEAAAYLHRSKQAIYTLVFKGLLPHSKPVGSRRLYFRREDLDAYAFSGREESHANLELRAEEILLYRKAR